MKKEIKAFGWPITKHEVIDQFRENQRYKWRFDFPNRYGVSVIRKKGHTMYHVTVIGKNGCLDPDHPLMYGKPDWICPDAGSVKAFLKRVASLAVILISIWIFGCTSSVFAVRICTAPNQYRVTCATGWYDTDGSIVTAAHAFLPGTPVDIEIEIGYQERAEVIEHEGLDSAIVVGNEKWYKSNVCYSNASIGDRITIAVYKGIVIGKIKAIRNNGDVYIVDTDGIFPGDFGAPVIGKDRCVIGQVIEFFDDGAVIVVKTYRNK